MVSLMFTKNGFVPINIFCLLCKILSEKKNSGKFRQNTDIKPIITRLHFQSFEQGAYILIPITLIFLEDKHPRIFSVNFSSELDVFLTVHHELAIH